MTDDAVLLDEELPTEPDSPARISRLKWLPPVAMWTTAGISFALTLLYHIVNDLTPWGEFFTIWPSFFWCVGLVPISLLSWDRERKWRFAVAFGTIVLFVAFTGEWRSLFRFGGSTTSPPRTGRRSVMSTETDFVFRVISWNVAGASNKQAVLAAMKRCAPDICFLQETPSVARTFSSADLSGYWNGFHWVDAGDCGLLCRWPFRSIPTRPIGPWADPQAALVDLPSSRTLLAVNVRLMLPSLIINPFDAGARAQLHRNHRARKAQFPALVELINDLVAEYHPDAIVLAGDFNTPGDALTVRALRSANLRDAWLDCGHGWGATMTADYPVSRIDQCWTSPIICPLTALVRRATVSDHRMVVFEMAIAEPVDNP